MRGKVPYSQLPSLSMAVNKLCILGTVYGYGYDCRTGKISKFEGKHEEGIWNKVGSHHLRVIPSESEVTEGVKIGKKWIILSEFLHFFGRLPFLELF